ncbi:MAG: DUF2282 domain-containing protein [Zetaproteobacteria bacterium]|nr:DUF2282 domain-containing protein [Zetaproteobacteria bacterium]
MKSLKTVAMGAMVTSMTSCVGMTEASESSAAVSQKVECKGIALQYINGCAANGHECSAQAAKDWDENEWIEVASAKDCKFIQDALQSSAMRKYVEDIRDETIALTKRGKFGK